MKNDIELISEEESLLEEESYNETPPADIIAFNELRSCADLVRMYEANQLIIDPDFQRDVVWKNPAQTRFIDSLVKQLPIPSMCISLDYKTDKRLMIDGLQRMSSIIKFLTNDEWRLSNIDDIDPKIAGKTVAEIRAESKNIYSRIENVTIPVTVLRCDYSKFSHMSYLFTIFHRLNTGGNRLTNQEIRNCIYNGRFNNFLKEIVADGRVRKLLLLEDVGSHRFAYEELFLRVFAFSENLTSYSGRLAKFLNVYMDEKKNISEGEINIKKSRIFRCIDLLTNKVVAPNGLKKVNKTTIEALLLAVYTNVDCLEGESSESLGERFKKLKDNDNFSPENLRGGLSSSDKVFARLNAAVEIFGCA